MSGINHLSEWWLAWIVASSWQLALLVCVVALASRGLRSAAPRLRYGLWLLVLVKVFLPPNLTTPLSVGWWGVRPLVATTGLSPTILETSNTFASTDKSNDVDAPEIAGPAPAIDPAFTKSTLWMIVWGSGVLIFWGAVGGRYARVLRLIRAAQSLDEGPARVAIELIAIDLRLRRVPELLITDEATSPFLFGVIRPRIVLSAELLPRLSEVELRAVLTHELVHFRRGDTWIGWLQVLANSLFWFHPFVWWANRGLRHERECVCDEAVLRLGRVTPEQYGESIFHVLTASRGRSLVAGSMVGVFERGAKLQNRLEDVMNYKPERQSSTWATRGALAVFAILFLPMAPGVVAPRIGAAGEGANAADAKETAKTSFPQIVTTNPKPGATGVDAALAEITITFDRDMGRGMSWTGGAPLFPPLDEGKKPRWIDARTCALPVKLEQGAYYRVGVNSTSHRNFRGADGEAVPPSAIYFSTTGATSEVESRVGVPKIVKLSPENGAKNVDPTTATLEVTFDQPMGEGMSWTGSGPKFPVSPDGKKPSWSKDGLTCTLPVKLEPGRDYELGLNSQSHINFQSKWGVPLAPVVYKFTTRASKE